MAIFRIYFGGRVGRISDRLNVGNDRKRNINDSTYIVRNDVIYLKMGAGQKSFYRVYTVCSCTSMWES